MDKISKVVGLHRRTVSRYINKLKDKGLVTRIGSDKTGHWDVKDDKH